MVSPPPPSPLFPYTTLFRSFIPGDEIAISLDIAASDLYLNNRYRLALDGRTLDSDDMAAMLIDWLDRYPIISIEDPLSELDRKSTRLNSSHRCISYAVFCLK